jgi:uncharacterized protein (TIGR00251 family)
MSLPDFLTPAGSGVVIEAFVQPRSARNAVAGIHGSALKLKVTAPPLEDRANRAVESFVADLLELPKSNVSVIHGRSSRHKWIQVAGRDAKSVAAILEVSLSPGGVLSCRAHEPGEEVPEEDGS